MGIYVLDGNFMVGMQIFDSWTHVVMNFIGPKDGQGIKGYANGILRRTDYSLGSATFYPGDGRIVMGRTYTDNSIDSYYANFDLDELFIFNEKLNEDEILVLKNIA